MTNGNHNHGGPGCGSGTCGASGESQKKDRTFPAGEDLRERMARVKNKILILSGKGGVGKSTIAVNMAVALALAGKRAGLLDVDVHGPSIPKLLNLGGKRIEATDAGIIPIGFGENLKVMSLGLLLQGQNEPVIWRGPLKFGVIRQFLQDVIWGDLDFLVVDSPPGTGDEPLSVAQLLLEEGGGVHAVIVTTPQEVALADVRKSVNFCRSLNVPVIGVVENMSGFVCPHCGTASAIFKTGGGEQMAREMGVKFLGSVPLDPQVVEASDEGKPYLFHFPRTETAKAFNRVIRPIMEMQDTQAPGINEGGQVEKEAKAETLRIAVPVAEGKLAMHFGHCERFALIDVDPDTKRILKQEMVEAPEHQPGLLPKWLMERGVHLVIAGGMGSRAQNLFTQSGIKVITGAPCEVPEALVAMHLAGTLKTGENICDH